MRTLLFIVVVFTGSAAASEPRCTGIPTPADYAGHMFDAMAQIESGMAGAVTAGLDQSGVARMALFARLHRKRNGEADVLSLKQRYGQRFVIGAPKSFDHSGDLLFTPLR